MKGSVKRGSLAEHADWLALESPEWKPTYSGMTGELKQLIRDQMLVEQSGLCVYCGRILDLQRPGKTFHIEHFRPQNRFKSLDVDYYNMFLSCGQEGSDGLPAPTCGSRKASWFDEAKNVYPSYPDCTTRFQFTLNGMIMAANEDDEAAHEMILRLALNHPELIKDREFVIARLDTEELEADDFFDLHTAMAESYAHIAFQHVGRTMLDRMQP